MIDKELERMSDEELQNLSLPELQRIRNKRWANRKTDLVKRANDELDRRDPRKNWKCSKCNSMDFYEKEIRVTGSFMSSFLGVETQKFHVIICSSCGKSEMYDVLMQAHEKTIGFFGS